MFLTKNKILMLHIILKLKIYMLLYCYNTIFLHNSKIFTRKSLLLLRPNPNIFLYKIYVAIIMIVSLFVMFHE